jgi:hypothetical protein
MDNAGTGKRDIIIIMWFKKTLVNVLQLLPMLIIFGVDEK